MELNYEPESKKQETNSGKEKVPGAADSKKGYAESLL